MASLESDAVTALGATTRGLLPPPVDPVLPPGLTMRAMRIAPTGIGGYVGTNGDPLGQILGRRVEATLAVTVKVTDRAHLDDAVASVTDALVAGPADDRRAQGILDVSLDALGDSVESTGDAGKIYQREVVFRVLYEYLRRPISGEGTITTIPLNLETAGAATMMRSLVRGPVQSDALDAFEVVDDPMARRNKPSHWQVAPASGRIEQTAPIYGGSAGVSANKPGTYLVMRSTSARPPLKDFVLRAALGASDNHGIGVVFRYQDPSNFYFFLMQADRNFRLLGRKSGGTFSDLTPQARVTGHSFVPGQTYHLELRADGERFDVAIDGEPPLSGTDGLIAAPGRVGLLAWQNPGAFFHDIDLAAL